MRHRRVDSWNPLGRLPCPVPPPPTCVAASRGAVVSHSGNSPCARFPEGGQQDAPEVESIEECRPDERRRIKCNLSPASGRHSILQIVPDGLSHRHLGGTPLDSSGGTVHSRQKERPCGSVKSSRPDLPNRMVPAALCVRQDLPGVRTPHLELFATWVSIKLPLMFPQFQIR